MDEKRITELERLKNPCIDNMLELGTYKLIGVSYDKYIEYSKKPTTGDIVIRYE